MPQSSDDLATLLANARSNNTTIALRDEIIPQNVQTAYDVYSRTVTALGEPVIGWKVNISAEGSGRGAPMLASGLVASGGEWRSRSQRRSVIEIEIALRLRNDLPPRPGKPYSRHEILEACGSVITGFEMVESRIALDGNKMPPLLSLADCMSNGGYVVGAEESNFRPLDLNQLRCRLWCDDELVSDRVGGHAFNDVLRPMEAWANDQADMLGGLKAGQFVTTGTLAPALRLDRPARVTASINGIGDVAVNVF